MHFVCFIFDLAELRVGRRRAANIEIIAMTTSTSISEKACRGLYTALGRRVLERFHIGSSDNRRWGAVWQAYSAPDDVGEVLWLDYGLGSIIFRNSHCVLREALRRTGLRNGHENRRSHGYKLRPAMLK